MSLDFRLPVERPRATLHGRALLYALPTGAAALVYVAYLLGHPYPAYGAGFFLETAERIAANGYHLPVRIEGYTAGGVPLAYPPLAFYVLALLVDGAGLDPFVVVRFLPGLLVVAYVLVYDGLASELSGSARQAALAAVLLATAPPVLQWHLSAGGVVRALAFLFALVAVYAGVQTFRTHTAKWVVAAAVAFALVVLTHPTYAVFAAASVLLLYVGLDRSVRGLAAGAVVGLGGLALAGPWLHYVATVHGIEVFLTASGTHGGLGVGPRALFVRLAAPLLQGSVQSPFYALVYLGAGWALWRRRWLLPAWLLATALVVPGNRFLFVPGSMLSAAFVYEAVVPAVSDRASTPGAGSTASTLAVGVVVVGAVTAGTLYGAGAVAGIRGDGPALPAFVDEADVEAMAWSADHTSPEATFVALGDAAEWLPFVADRTILVGPWGAEWRETEGYPVQYARYESVSACRTAACIARSLDRFDVRPDYVYVPRGAYTVSDEHFVQSSSMVASLAASDRFRVVYANEGVVIAAVGESYRPARRRPPTSHASSTSASATRARTATTSATTSTGPIQTGVT